MNKKQVEAVMAKEKAVLKWWLSSYSPRFSLIGSNLRFPEWVKSRGVDWGKEKRFVVNEAGFKIYKINSLS